MASPQNKVLADIITSSRVGLNHVSLAGCLLMLEARFNSLLFGMKGALSPDVWVELGEEVLAYQEAYETAWVNVAEYHRQETDDSWDSLRPLLARLEDALRHACETSVSLIEKIGGVPLTALPVDLVRTR